MRTQLFQDRWPIVSLGDLQSPDLLRVTEFIKGAVEIHVIDSCLLNLLDCWSYEPRHPSQKLIYHRYAKGAGYQPPTVIKKKWLTIQ